MLIKAEIERLKAERSISDCGFPPLEIEAGGLADSSIITGTYL
jgi:hypothetical protein